MTTTTQSTTTTSSSPVRPPRTNHQARREALAAVAAETRTVLPDILRKLPSIQAAKAEALFLDRLAPLDPADCPGYTKTAIQVVNEDTFNAAITLASSLPPPTSTTSARVAVLNMASHSSPGGGWIRGAFAQEEMLCYRSSLSLSLHRRYYPWKQRMGLYTRDVVVIRSDMPSGHALLAHLPADQLPVVSALSIAALRTPAISTSTVRLEDGSTVDEEMYARPQDRDLTKDKMRLCLRMAAARGHGRLVLGALGCGAFRNPPGEVARCWREVFAEAEFAGGWWESVVFAVYDTKGEGNFAVFESVLGGVEV